MMKEPSHQIASRTYQLAEGQAVVLSVFNPELVEGDTVCKFRIAGLSREIESHAFGTDEIQAILLALTRAASILYTSDEYKSGQLSWLGSTDLGLPRPASIQEILG